MSNTLKKVLSLVLALTMVLALAACGSTAAPATTSTATAAPAAEATAEPAAEPAVEADTRLAADVFPELFDPDTYNEDSSRIYEEVLGEFYELYQESKQYTEADDLAMRFALMAQAEAKLLGSAIMIPLQSRGGNYAISRVAPRTVNSTLWGSDNERYHQAVIVKGDFLTLDEVNEIRAQWGELQGTGTFEAWVKEYLTSNGHELNDEYNMASSSDPNTWDTLATSMEADTEKII